MNLEVNGLGKFYNDKSILEDISFSVKTGEVLGILGNNGAGKSTLMKIIATYIKPDKGQVLYENLEFSNKNRQYIRKEIGYLPENNPLYNEMYVKEYFHFCAKAYQKYSEVDFFVDIMGLKDHLSRKIGMLSKGYRQRVGLAATLLHQPSLLILDEPTNGLDVEQTMVFRDTIRQVSKGKTILYCTHLLEEVKALCDKTLCLKNGKIGDVFQVKQSDILL